MARPSVEPWLGLSMTGTLPTHATRGVRVSPEVLAEAFYASCRYLLRVILAGVDGSKGDIIDAVLLTAIMDADIGHLDEIAALGWRYATYADGPPDGFRRPTSVRSLSDRLGLPYETARRRVDGLITQGRCVRTEHGVHARLIVRRQDIWLRWGRKLAESGPRLGVDVRRRACGAASADIRGSVA